MTQPWGQSVVYQRDYPGLHSPFSAHNVGLNIRKRLVNLPWSLLQARTMLIVPALPSANLLPFRFCSCYISDSFVLTVSLCSFYVNGCYFKSNKWRERKRGLNCVALLQLRIWRWACCRATASETPRLPLLCRLDLNNEVFSLFSADGPPVVGHYDISDTDSDQESMSVETVRPTVIKHELKTHRGQDLAAHSGCIRAQVSYKPSKLIISTTASEARAFLRWEGSSLSTILSGKNAPYVFCLLSRLKNLPLPFSAPQCVLSHLPAALPPFHHCVLLCRLSERHETRNGPLVLSLCHSRSLACFRSHGGEAVAQWRLSSQGPHQRRFLWQRGGNSGRARESTVKDWPGDHFLLTDAFLNEFPLCPSPDVPIRAVGW